ncbi:MAG TPA: CDC27 family protein [Phycisphaerae bacterium]|nr:CDC27 family protein [Phycisphaerae bacterium]
MSRYFLGAFALVIGLPSVAPAQQNTSRLGRAIERSQPLPDEPDEERRLQKNEDAYLDRAPDYIEGDRLLRMPQGHYEVAPDKYRPDHWSPRIRPRFDYGGRGIGCTSRSSRYSHRYRNYGGGSCGNRSFGYYGGYGYPGYGYPGHGDPGDAYIQGRYDSDHEYQDYIASERAGRLLSANRIGVAAGLSHFQAGRYDRAAIEWLGASEKNHGDAASRVFAGHALFAVGRYDEAVKVLARAFELAPYLTESYYDVRAEYGDPADFEGHLLRLKAYVARHPDCACSTTLLGYVVAYSDGPAAANPILERAGRLNPRDFFVARLLKISRTVTPLGGTETAGEKPGSTKRSIERNESNDESLKQPMAIVHRGAPRDVR